MTGPAPAGEILLLVHRVPFPPDRGDKIRSYRLLRALERLGPVHLATFADDERDVAAGERLAEWTASRCIVRRAPSKPVAALRALTRGEPLSLTLFHDARIADYVRATLAQRPIRAIAVFSGQMAQYVPDDFAGTVLMDLVDVDSAKFAAYARDAGPLSPMRFVYAREARRLAAVEAAIARRADATTLVSAAEAALFARAAGVDAGGIHALENGIDTAEYDPATVTPDPAAAGDGPLTVFTGQMDYRPNIDAVAWFARQVLPQLRAQHPAARFAIVGRAPTREVTALAALPGVIVTGAVDDVRGWIAAADVVVAPLLLARGIQNKVLEAMAMARPVVASPAAAEGIDAADGTHMIVAPDAAAMTAAIERLIADPPAAQAMGAAARARMIERYGWDARFADVPRLLRWER